MFTEDRRNAIKKILYETKRVDVSELSARLQVSEVTIRKDLIYLEKAGILIRTHGGAVLMESNAGMPNPYENDGSTESRHHAIALVVACMVSEGELIYLGAGPVCTDIAKELKKKAHLNVLTNNITAAVLLSENPNINIITPPGELSRKQDICVLTGEDTVSYMDSRYVDKAILSVDAAKFSTGFSIQDPGICKIYSQAILHADEKIIAVNSDNFNKNAISPLGALTIADKVVSDENMPEDYISFFYSNNIQVYTSYDIENI